MEHQVEIGIIGGELCIIKKGFPKEHKSRMFPNAICFHINMDNHEYILFQLVKVGPYSCWHTEYLFKSHKRMYCNMKSEGVEFHSMIEGRVMYNMDRDLKMFLTSGGTYNILVNPPLHTKTFFTSKHIITFDIHVEEKYFIGLMEQYPVFKKLQPALESGDLGLFFPKKEEIDLKLKVQINNIIRRFAERSIITQEDEADVMEQLDAIIGSFGSSDESKEQGAYNMDFKLIDDLMNIEVFLKENYMDNKAVALAEKAYKMSSIKLKKNFEILFGKKPKEYLIAEQIKRVKYFIKSAPDVDKDRIVSVSGYKDARYFYALFKKYTGVSIEEYRLQIKEQNIGIDEDLS